MSNYWVAMSRCYRVVFLGIYLGFSGLVLSAATFGAGLIMSVCVNANEKRSDLLNEGELTRWGCWDWSISWSSWDKFLGW